MSRDRDIHHLHKLAAEAWLRLEAGAYEHLGIELRCIETHRLVKLQDSDYAKGRDAEGNIIDKNLVVTSKRGGDSTHNLTRVSDGQPMSAAFHAAIVLPRGRLLGLPKLGPAGVLVYKAVAELARQQGLRCGAKWKDYMHFELRGNDLKKAKADAAA